MREKLAIFLDTEKHSGGAYHELAYMLEKLNYLYKNELDIIIISTSPNLKINSNKINLKTHYLKMNFFERHIAFLRNYDPTIRRLKKYFFFQNKFEKLLRKLKIDLVYFTGPSQYSLYLEDTDFIITIPDVSHRENLEFPEWTKSSEFQRRDEIISKSSVKAIAVITNAEIIKDKISSFYSVEKERIYVINHRPSLGISNFKNFSEDLSIEIKKKYNLPKKYIFYPAMYLPHKNHKYLIDVIKILNTDLKLEMSAVFCGSDKGYLEKIKKYSEELAQINNIIFLDYVDDEHLPYLYLNSVALTMPTFSGPTNIPPWEAFILEVPVLYSDIHNIREVYRDAVFYIDPFEPSTMAKGLVEILTNNSKKNELLSNGKKILQSVDEKKEFNQFYEILKKRRKIKNTWEFNN
jgi:glycosyltransferase involved in cell wall biosynthesis